MSGWGLILFAAGVFILLLAWAVQRGKDRS